MSINEHQLTAWCLFLNHMLSGDILFCTLFSSFLRRCRRPRLRSIDYIWVCQNTGTIFVLSSKWTPEHRRQQQQQTHSMLFFSSVSHLSECLCVYLFELFVENIEHRFSQFLSSLFSLTQCPLVITYGLRLCRLIASNFYDRVYRIIDMPRSRNELRNRSSSSNIICSHHFKSSDKTDALFIVFAPCLQREKNRNRYETNAQSTEMNAMIPMTATFTYPRMTWSIHGKHEHSVTGHFFSIAIRLLPYSTKVI